MHASRANLSLLEEANNCGWKEAKTRRKRWDGWSWWWNVCGQCVMPCIAWRQSSVNDPFHNNVATFSGTVPKLILRSHRPVVARAWHVCKLLSYAMCRAKPRVSKVTACLVPVHGTRPRDAWYSCPNLCNRGRIPCRCIHCLEHTSNNHIAFQVRVDTLRCFHLVFLRWNMRHHGLHRSPFPCSSSRYLARATHWPWTCRMSVHPRDVHPPHGEETLDRSQLGRVVSDT